MVKGTIVNLACFHIRREVVDVDGGQCRTRTCDLLLVRHNRTRIQRVTLFATDCDESQQLTMLDALR